MTLLPPSLQLITSPSEENSMYVQQRDEYLESVCEMAIRKVSIITVFGSLTNSTMKIDHYQLGKLWPCAVLSHNITSLNALVILEFCQSSALNHPNAFFTALSVIVAVAESHFCFKKLFVNLMCQ